MILLKILMQLKLFGIFLNLITENRKKNILFVN